MKSRILLNFQDKWLMSNQDILICEERIQGQRLRIEIQQIDKELLQLKHHYDECAQIINLRRPTHQIIADMQFIKSKANQAKIAIQNFKTIQHKTTQSNINNIQATQKLQQEQFNNLLLNQQQQTFRVLQKNLNKRIAFYQKQYQSTKQKFNIVGQQLFKRQDESDLVQKLTNFIQQLKTKFPNNISQQEINKLQSLNFNQFSMIINEQILQIKQQIVTFRDIIKQIRERYITVDIQLRNQGNTEVQLQNLQTEHNELNEQITQLINYNDHLEIEMDQQVDKIVRDKINTINNDSYQHAHKYLLTGMFILDKFGAILDEDQLNNLQDQLKRSHQSITQKFMQQN